MNDSNEALIKRIGALLRNDVCKRSPLIVPILEECRAALTASSERLTSEQRLALAKGSDADKVRLWQEYYWRLAARFEALDTASSEPVADMDLMLDDLGDLLRALGMFDGAQPISPHAVMQKAIAEIKRRSEQPPVAWRYARKDKQDVLLQEERWLTGWNPNYWTETPLVPGQGAEK